MPQRIPVKITVKKKPGGELICKNFGVNGKSRKSIREALVIRFLRIAPLSLFLDHSLERYVCEWIADRG